MILATDWKYAKLKSSKNVWGILGLILLGWISGIVFGIKAKKYIETNGHESDFIVNVSSSNVGYEQHSNPEPQQHKGPEYQQHAQMDMKNANKNGRMLRVCWRLPLFTELLVVAVAILFAVLGQKLDPMMFLYCYLACLFSGILGGIAVMCKDWKDNYLNSMKKKWGWTSIFLSLIALGFIGNACFSITFDRVYKDRLKDDTEAWERAKKRMKDGAKDLFKL